MYAILIFLIFLSILTSIDSQYVSGFPSGSHGDRKLEALFNGTFNRSRCPELFYQSGDECLYFLTPNNNYSWKEAEETCSGQIARLLSQQQTSSTSKQPKITPTKGVRQVILNTPRKTEIFRVLFREYQQQNFAVRLPSDYGKLERCHAADDAEFPHYCVASERSNSSCLETKLNWPKYDICIQEVDCKKNNLRLACEFTLSGSAEITTSKFSHCLESGGRRGMSWLIIGMIGGFVFFLVVFGFICLFVRKRNKLRKKQNSEPETSPLTPSNQERHDNLATQTLINSDNGVHESVERSTSLPSRRPPKL